MKHLTCGPAKVVSRRPRELRRGVRILFGDPSSTCYRQRSPISYGETSSRRTHKYSEVPMFKRGAPNLVDKHVGSRVRMRRMMLGMSQEKLGDGLGLTMQQVQKYEKGANRIGASRLQHISHILQVPVPFFFEGAPHVLGQPEEIEEAPSPAYVFEFLA